MPDTDINAGSPLRFENGGKIRIFNNAGSSSYNVLLVQDGTLQVDDADREGIPYMDRSSLSGNVVEGDQRPSFIRFSGKVTKLGMTGAAELLSVLRPAAASGLKTTYKVEIDLFDARGGSTGLRCTGLKCWVPEPVNYRAGGAGPNLDTLDIVLRVEGASVAWTTFS